MNKLTTNLFCLFLLSSIFSIDAWAENVTLSFLVKDKRGHAIENLVVTLFPKDVSSPPNLDPKTKNMSQENRLFDPHVLVLKKGDSVQFPNKDDIQHHVYSFSKAKKFEMRLSKQSIGKTLTFENPGIVSLGCNIHDWMLAHIIVTDSPYFSKTNDKGEATIQLPKGNYELKTWHAQLNNAKYSKPELLNVSGDLRKEININKRVVKREIEVDDLEDFDSY